MGSSGEARGHACHAVHDQRFLETKILFMKFHGQNAHKTKSCVLYCDYIKEQYLILVLMTILFHLAGGKTNRIQSAYDQNYVISMDDYYDSIWSCQFENRTSEMTPLQV